MANVSFLRGTQAGLDKLTSFTPIPVFKAPLLKFKLYVLTAVVNGKSCSSIFGFIPFANDVKLYILYVIFFSPRLLL